MDMAGLLLVVLSHAGYWFGGGVYDVEFAWNLDNAIDTVVVEWYLSTDNQLLLESGKVDLSKQDEGRAAVHLRAPNVRVRTALTLTYRAVTNDDGRVIETGTRRVIVFPAPDVDGVRQLVAQTHVVVWGSTDFLQSLVQVEETAIERIDELSELRFQVPDAIIVAPGQMPATGDEFIVLTRLARAGSDVLILRQESRVMRGDFTIRWRRMADTMALNETHELMDGLSESEWRSWLGGLRDVTPAVYHQGGTEFVDVVSWHPVAASDDDARHALVSIQSVGRGRVIFCQVPVDQAAADPRQWILLRNLVTLVGG